MTTLFRKSFLWPAFCMLLAANAAEQESVDAPAPAPVPAPQKSSPTPNAAAQESAPAPGPVPASGDDRSLSRFSGLFEIDLPKTERRGNIRFIYQPHFRDLIDKSYLRIPLEFRWGVNDHFELNSDIDTYLTHGLRRATTGYGLSRLHFGAKYAWHIWLKPTWDTSVGFNSTIPVSRPPIELTDGHKHFTPYIVFGRQLKGVPGLSGFVQSSVDIVAKSPTPGNFGENQPHSDSVSVAPGLLYDRKAWHYTLEVTGTTTRLIGNGSHDFLTIRPGVIWDLPKALVFHARGRWLAGFNVTAVFGPDGNKISTGGRLRGVINFSRWFQRGQQDKTPPDESATGH